MNRVPARQRQPQRPASEMASAPAASRRDRKERLQIPPSLLTYGAWSVAADDLCGTQSQLGNIYYDAIRTVAVIVFVESPEGEQRFDLAPGESVTVTGVTKPIEIRTVGL